MFAITKFSRSVARSALPINSFASLSVGISTGQPSRTTPRTSQNTAPNTSQNKHPLLDSNVPLDISNYPQSKANTILNICNQGSRMVVETLGKFSYVQEPGWFLAIPLIHEIKYVVDDRELVIDVYKQYAHTYDNVRIGIAAQLYLQITDAHKACYKVKQPLVAVVSHAQSAMRSSIGKYDLDYLLKDRASINRDIDAALSKSEENWGIRINRVEITELTPDENIARAMDLQATAERERRSIEKIAEAKKRAIELEAEGYKSKLINEASGRAEALRIETEARAKAITAIEQTGIPLDDVLKFQMTQLYLDRLTHLAASGKHTTFFLGKDISNVKAMTGNVLDLLGQYTSNNRG